MRIARHAGIAAAALALLASAPALAAGPPQIVRPPAETSLSAQELGRQLFAGNCSTCHGSLGQGVPATSPQRGSTAAKGFGPTLHGVGKLSTDFYLRTGYMPLAQVPQQPQRRRPAFNNREITAIEDYVDSLGPGPGPPIPTPDPAKGSLSEGLQLFTEHCAGCH